jgi:dTDP-4-amino-4,6-dideoxygalactose transaminase
VKHIATGEGGMITTNDKALYDKLNLLRTHGITKDSSKFLNSPAEVSQGGWYYEMQELGYNYRLSDFQAALGTSQLKRADENLARRRELAKRYDKAFTGTKVRPAPAADGNAYHLYVIRVDDRSGLYEHLKANGIFAQVHYVPVHLMPYYKQFGHKKGDHPKAEAYYEKCLSIPMYHSLSNEDQDRVIQTILNFMS